MFYAYREAAFDIKVERAETTDSKLHIFEPVYDHRVGPLYPFPDELIPDADDKKALLSFFACQEAPDSIF